MASEDEGPPRLSFEMESQPAPAHAQGSVGGAPRSAAASLLDFEPGLSQIHRKSLPEGARSSTLAPVGRTTTLSTGLNLITVMVGAGVLGFPAVMSQAGWIAGPLVLLASGFAMVETGLAISDSVMLCEERMREGATYSFLRPERFEDLAEAAFGPVGAILAGVLINFFLMGLCGAYMILIGASMEFLTSELLSSNWWVLVSAVFVGGLSLLKDMSVLSRLSVLGVAASVTYVISIAEAGIVTVLNRRGTEAPTQWRNFPETGPELGFIVSVMVMGFGYHTVLPTIRAEMLNPREMPLAIRGSVSLAVFIYMGVGLVGYWAWGDIRGKVTDVMLNDDCSQMLGGLALAIAVVINLTVTLPILLSVVAMTFESRCGLGYSPPVRLGLVVVIVVVALTCPVFLPVIGLLGSTVGSFCIIFLPLGIYWKLAMAPGREMPPRLTQIKHVFALIMGVAALLFGTSQALNDLSEALGSHPGSNTTGSGIDDCVPS